MDAANVFHIIEQIKLLFEKSCFTFLVNLRYSFYPNLKLGKKTIFIGFPKFRNKPGGKIIIGDSCTFLSSAKSNFIGINRPCIFSTHKSEAIISIGKNCGFSGTIIGAFKSIKIGDNVRCGANTLITDSDWHLDDKRSGEPKSIIIEENVWLGTNSIILKGVNIGKNSVIGAGSVVTKSIPANVVAAGNPCRIIKTIVFND